MSILIILAIAAGAILLWVVAVYNSLVTLRNRSKEAWSDIDVQLKRRYDLIPNLVETVKGYATHEKETFEKVIKARNKAKQSSFSNKKKKKKKKKKHTT